MTDAPQVRVRSTELLSQVTGPIGSTAPRSASASPRPISARCGTPVPARTGGTGSSCCSVTPMGGLGGRARCRPGRCGLADQRPAVLEHPRPRPRRTGAGSRGESGRRRGRATDPAQPAQSAAAGAVSRAHPDPECGGDHRRGGVHYVHWMSILKWGGPGGRWRTFQAGIAASADDAQTWRKPLHGRWPNPLGRNRFQVGAFTRTEEHVYLFGTTNGRFGPAYLARVAPPERVEWVADYEYFDGAGWSRSQAAAAPVIDGPVGELSVAFHRGLGCWLAVTLDEPRAAIVLRSAARITGPWSEPEVLAAGTDYPGLYGGFIHPWQLDGDSLYWLLSQWGTVQRLSDAQPPGPLSPDTDRPRSPQRTGVEYPYGRLPSADLGCLVLDLQGNLLDLVAVLAAVVSAEQKLATPPIEGDAYIGLGPTTIATIGSGQAIFDDGSSHGALFLRIGSCPVNAPDRGFVPSSVTNSEAPPGSTASPVLHRLPGPDQEARAFSSAFRWAARTGPAGARAAWPERKCRCRRITCTM